MKKGLTELVFILDRSGSMQGLEADTIGGFNGMIEKQRKQERETNVTTAEIDGSWKGMMEADVKLRGFLKKKQKK